MPTICCTPLQIGAPIELVTESDELAHTTFQTLARDAELRCEYDRGHSFELEGSTAAGEPRVPQMSADDFFAQKRLIRMLV